jgi:hypothetical protein
MEKQKINPTTIIVTLIIVVGILAGIYFLRGGGVREGLTVQGNSQMTVAPDNAIVYLLIQTKDNSAEEAKNKNSEISDGVLTELIKLGLERKDIQTENYNIYPDYKWINNQQISNGYVASNYIKIETKDFDKIGRIVDVSVDAGALVNYINFELSIEKSNQYKAEVLENATKDARTQAEAIASGLGKRVGNVISVTTNDYNYYPYRFYDNMEMVASSSEMKEAATNIAPKNLDITANVQVVFKIW